MKSYIIFGANSDIASNLIEQLSTNNKVYAIARSFHTHTYSGKNIETIEESPESQFGFMYRGEAEGR